MTGAGTWTRSRGSVGWRTQLSWTWCRHLSPGSPERPLELWSVGPRVHLPAAASTATSRPSQATNRDVLTAMRILIGAILGNTLQTKVNV